MDDASAERVPRARNVAIGRCAETASFNKPRPATMAMITMEMAVLSVVLAPAGHASAPGTTRFARPFVAMGFFAETSRATTVNSSMGTAARQIAPSNPAGCVTPIRWIVRLSVEMDSSGETRPAMMAISYPAMAARASA